MLATGLGHFTFYLAIWPQFLHKHWKSHMDFAKPQENQHSTTSAVASIYLVLGYQKQAGMFCMAIQGNECTSPFFPYANSDICERRLATHMSSICKLQVSKY